MSNLEIAEQYIEWAAARQLSAAHVIDVLLSWPALKLSEEERGYIQYYARRKCQPEGWRRFIPMLKRTG